MRRALLSTMLVLLAGCTDRTLDPTAPHPIQPRRGVTVTSGLAYKIMLSFDALPQPVAVGGVAFGPAIARMPDFILEAEIVRAVDQDDAGGPSTFDACSPLTNASAIAGNIALVDRGTCPFVVKVKNAQDAGAVAVIVRNNAGGPVTAMGGNDPTITIPAVFMTFSDGIALVDAISTRGSEAGRISVEETAPPTVTVPDDINVQTVDPTGTVVNYSVSATLGGADAPPFCAPATTGLKFPVGTTTITCSVIDAWQNTASASFTVTVQLLDPSAATAFRILLSSDAPLGPVAVGGATFGPALVHIPDFILEGAVVQALDAADNGGPSTLDACTPLTNGGAIAGNIAIVDRGTCSFATKVRNAQDAGAIGVIVRNNVAGAIAGMGGSDATILIPSVLVRQVDGTMLLNALRLRPVTVRISLEPTTAPTIAVPNDIVATTSDRTGTVVDYTASATVGGIAGTPICNPRASGSRFPIGVTTVTCTASDVWQNTASGSFNVTVRLDDLEPPVVTVPAPIFGELTGPLTNVAFVVTATDNVGVVGDPSCSRASGSAFPLGVTEITCTARDAAGNTGSARFTITILDTTRPTLTVPSIVVANATSPAGAAVSYVASATDLSGTATLSCAPISGSIFAIGTTQVTCTATDASNNVATASFTVSVKGAAAQVTDLQQAVAGLNLQEGTETSVQAKLSAALAALASGNRSSACGSLNALTNQVSAQSGKKITVLDAQALIATVDRIRSVAGC